jgi:serine/threonine-protein phosphatase PGAM5
MNRVLLCLIVLALSICAHAAEAPAPAPAARTIYLLRHGHYGPDPAADRRLGPGLSPLGIAQAHLLGARLAALPTRFDALYVSPLRRARDTAAAISADFPQAVFSVVDDLAECTPPARRADFMAGERPADMAACSRQLDRFFARYFKPASGKEQTELMVCHGNVIRSLIVRALGVDADAWSAISIGHASISEIRIGADGRIRVVSVGDVGHIPPNLRTGAAGDPERNLTISATPH